MADSVDIRIDVTFLSASVVTHMPDFTKHRALKPRAVMDTADCPGK